MKTLLSSLFLAVAAVSLIHAQQPAVSNGTESKPASDIYVADSDWKPLLTPALEGWEVFTGVPHKSVQIPGFGESVSENCQDGKPFGLGDPLKIFTVETVEEKPVLKISGQVYAGLTTKESFSNYHLTLQYKWGQKKWPPRVNKLRDSGVLLHCTGDHGAFWKVWKKSLECQVQETDTGDFIDLAGTSVKIPVRQSDLEEEMPMYEPNGQLIIVGAGVKKWGAQRLDGNVEIKDDWNRVDIYALGDKLRFVVNGTLVMQLDDCKNGNQSDGKPLEKGQIQIQSEAAEVDYRDVRIRSIDKLPTFDDE